MILRILKNPVYTGVLEQGRVTTPSYADMEVLPDDAIADLLDRVTVWPDGRLEVSLKFLNELPVSAVAEQRTKTTE